MNIQESSSEKNIKSNETISLVDKLLFFIALGSLLIGVYAHFSTYLMPSRPIFFGIFISMLVHRWMGGIQEGEITGVKSVFGNIKITGPLASMIASFIFLGMFYSIYDGAKTKPDESKLLAFDKDTGKEEDVYIVGDNSGVHIRKKTEDPNLFYYFVNTCYGGAVEGCKIPTTFKIENGKQLAHGEALICLKAFSKVPITATTKNLDNIFGLSVSTKQHGCPNYNLDNVITYISSSDAKTRRINNEETGYLTPTSELGTPILPRLPESVKAPKAQ